MKEYSIDLKTRCYQLGLKLITLVDNLPKERSCWIIGDQLLRSGMSIGANLVEATGAGSKIEFKKFHEIALKSANESKYWLGLLKDTHKVNQDKLIPILDEVVEISNMIAKGILRMKGKL